MFKCSPTHKFFYSGSPVPYWFISSPWITSSPIICQQFNNSLPTQQWFPFLHQIPNGTQVSNWFTSLAMIHQQFDYCSSAHQSFEYLIFICLFFRNSHSITTIKADTKNLMSKKKPYPRAKKNHEKNSQQFVAHVDRKIVSYQQLPSTLNTGGREYFTNSKNCFIKS